MFHSGKIDRVYLWGTRVLIYLIPVLPLYVSTSMLFPYITGKNFAFRIIVELAAVFWISLTAINRKYRLGNSAVVTSILIFTFIAGLAGLLGINPYKSFWSNYERMEGYITILHLTLYFMIIRSIMRTRKDWFLFFNIILTVSLFVCLFSLILPTATSGTRFWMEYNTRIYGTLGNPPFLAAYLLLTIFVGLIAFLYTKKIYLRIYYIGLILLSAVVIYFTATRGAILSFFLGLIAIGVFYFSAAVKRQNRKSINIAVALVVICLVAVTATTIVSHNTFKRDITLSRLATMFSDNSVQARLDSWKMAWNGIKEKPLLGWGQENFIGVYTVNPIQFKGEQTWTDRPHNIVIEWLINAGIFGLLSYLAILGSAIYTIWRKYAGKQLSKEEAVTIMTALLVYFIQNLFTFDTISTYFIFFALLAYIDSIGYERDNADSEPEKIINSKGRNMKALGLTFSMLLVFFAIFYFANYRPINESIRTSWISKSVSDYRSFSTLLEDFKRTMALNTFGDYDVRERMESVSGNILFYRLFSQEGALKFLEETIHELEKGILESHDDLEYLTGVITFYNNIAAYEPSIIPRSESLIKMCIKINPRYEWLNYALADIYKLKKEYDRMFDITKNMAVLDPLNDQKQMKLVLAAILVKKEAIVKDSLARISKIRAARNAGVPSGKTVVFEASELNSIAQAYSEVKNFREAIEYLNKVVIMMPDRAKVHFSLANEYVNLGDKSNALKELRTAAELDPSRYGETSKEIIDALIK